MIRKALILLSIPALVNAQSILIDFGNDASYRGTNVVNPDGNGSYWNSVDASTYWPGLVDINGSTTTVGFGFGTAGDTDFYNGPAGTNENPALVEIDAAALGLLGVNEAAYDFYSSSTFTIQGLDPAKTYTVTFFGSRKYVADPTTVYTIYASNDYAEAVALTALDVRSPTETWLHNSNQVARIKNIAPQFADSLWIGYQSQTGGVGYLNALLIEEYVPPVPEEMTFLIDFGSDESFRGTNVINPDINGNHWNSIAYGAASLVNITGGLAGVNFAWGVAGNTDFYNGPSGDVEDPSAVVIDATALGDLGINEAAYDYFASDINTSSTFAVTGLEPGQNYTLTFFSSRKFGTATTTTYTVYSDGDYSNAVSSTTLNVFEPGSPWLHNSNTVAVIENIALQDGDTLWIGFEGEGGNPGYLNAMKIELYQSPPAEVNFTAVSFSAGAANIGFVGVAGVEYALQFTTNLLATNSWLSVPGATATGDGLSTNLLSDTNTIDALRAYRLIAAP